MLRKSTIERYWWRRSSSAQTGSVDENLNDRAGGLGMGLPKFEMRALFTGLARKVRRFHVEEEERVLYNMLRGFSKLFGTVEHVLLASAYEPIAAVDNTRPGGSLFLVSNALADKAKMSMTRNSSRVVTAGPADMEPLISAMVLAFAGDPVARWMYRDPQRYLAYFGRFVRAFAGKAFSTGTAWCIDGNLGGALWLPRV
jgi:hypothetical protein